MTITCVMYVMICIHLLDMGRLLWGGKWEVERSQMFIEIVRSFKNYCFHSDLGLSKSIINSVQVDILTARDGKQKPTSFLSRHLIA